MRSISLPAQLRHTITDDADRTLAHAIFGTANIPTIGAVLDRYCQLHFHKGIATCPFAYISVGFTAVVDLTDGTTLVLKATGPQPTLEALTATCTVQNALAAQGFPCPTVLRAPQRCGAATLTAHTFCDPGDRVDPMASYIYLTMAHQLAVLIRQAKSLPQQNLNPWMDLRQTTLWHQPHNALFNFECTAAGAEWIDAIAHGAKQILRQATGPLVVGHSDWSLQNMSFRQGKLTCVYDWDSLRVGLEPCFVGGAARCFRHDWRYGPPPNAITPAEVLAFAEAYEQERGLAFTDEEWQTLGAAVVYTAAYGMRCAHATTRPDALHYQNSAQQLQAFVERFLPHET